MGREFELKFAATMADHEALQGRFGNLSPILMETTYYDTPDGAIRRLRWTLRCRQENGISVCALKTPGDGFGHGEWEVYCSRIEDAVPLLLEKGATALPLPAAQNSPGWRDCWNCPAARRSWHWTKVSCWAVAKKRPSVKSRWS